MLLTKASLATASDQDASYRLPQWCRVLFYSESSADETTKGHKHVFLLTLSIQYFRFSLFYTIRRMCIALATILCFFSQLFTCANAIVFYCWIFGELNSKKRFRCPRAYYYVSSSPHPHPCLVVLLPAVVLLLQEYALWFRYILSSLLFR